MKLNRSFRLVSVLLSTAVVPFQMGLCKENDAFPIDRLYGTQSTIKYPEVKKEMIQLAKVELKKFSSQFNDWENYDPLKKTLLRMIQENPALAIDVMQRVSPWMTGGGWLCLETIAAIKAFRDMDVKKIPFLYETLTPWVIEFDWGGFDTVAVLKAFKSMGKKRVLFLHETLTPWFDNGPWDGKDAARVIKAFKKINEKKITLHFINLTPWAVSGTWCGDGIAHVIKAFKHMDEERISFFYKEIDCRIKKYNWSSYGTARAIKAFRGMSEKKVSFLFNQIDSWIEACKWDGFDAAHVIKAIKYRDKKKIKFLCEIFTSWIEKRQWKGTDTVKIINVFADMEEKNVQPLFKGLTPWVEKSEMSGGKTAKIIGALCLVPYQLIEQTLELADSLSRKVWGKVDIKEILLGIDLFHGDDNKEDAECLIELIEKKTKKVDAREKKYLIKALLFHSGEGREEILRQWRPFSKDPLEFIHMSVLAFVPQEQWTVYLQKKSENGQEIESMEDLLLAYHQVLVHSQDLDHKKFLTNLYNHWKEVLHSPRAEVLKWCANFITDNSLALGIDEEDDDGLFQWAIRANINAENSNDPKNIFKIHNELLQKRKDFNAARLVMPNRVMDTCKVSLDSVFFQKMSVFLRFDPKRVPKVNERDFTELCESLKEKEEEIKKLTGQSVDSLLLEDKMSYLSHLLLSPNTHLLGAQWKCLVTYILSLTSLSKEAGLSEQQEVLALHLLSIQKCQTGKEDGIKRSYRLLPSNYRLKGMEFTSSPALWIMEILSQGIESMVNDGGFLRFLLNYEPHTRIAQESHQIKYLMGLIATHIGLPWQIQFDPHSNVLLDELLELKPQDVIQHYYKKVFTPLDVIDYLQNAINDRLREEKDPTAFANFLSSLVPSTLAKEMWHIEEKEEDDDWGYFYKNIKPYGVIKLLEAVGAMKVTPID